MPAGAPRKSVDEVLIRDLASIHCTDEEIAAMVGCSSKTLQRRYREMIDEARETGRASLRRLQWAAAQKGDKTMLIWLGKQQLGQRDRPEESGAHAESSRENFIAAVKRTPAELAELYADDDVDIIEPETQEESE